LKINPLLQALSSLAVATSLLGCVADRPYRQPVSALHVPPEPGKPSPSASLPVGNPCTEDRYTMTPKSNGQGRPIKNSSRPCIAYVEFNDQGKQSVPGQLNQATALIRKAIHDDPQHQPVILTFIHGWKHNASPGPPEDSNIQGFEHVLNYLYDTAYGGSDCTDATGPCTPIAGHLVVGIYIGWRGEIISHEWPVTRTLSLYSRGEAATRVGQGDDLEKALRQISNTAHPSETTNSPTQPMLVLVGHSFGARVLENAMNKLYLPFFEEKKSNQTQVPTFFADLIIYVNSAASADVAVPMLDYLARERLEFREDLPNLPPGNGLGRERPLMLSITTPADAATGVLFPIAMGGEAILKKVSGSLGGQQAISCYHPATQTISKNTSKSQFAFHASTAAHMDLIQSHEVIDLGMPPAAGMVSNCPAPGSPDSYSYGIPSRCFLIEPKKPLAGEEDRCNNTPYWILNTDGNIIPDHGTIFTNRLIRFIGEFLPTATATQISVPRLATKQQTRARQLQLH